MEYTALYRRFRPTTFSEIVGQDHIVTTLKNQVMADRVGHAYLFTGCRGCGKTSTAKVLARAINCLNPKNGEPCNECEICQSALEGTLTDVVEMDAASNTSVDDIRAIREEVNFLPTLAKYRVYIIDEVHMLSLGAFNALLKTLEEPPKHVKFILATTEPQKLPATILSRCQRFDFKKISDEEISNNLKKICEECKINYTEGAVNLISELSEGAMRDALSILERCAQDGKNKITEEKIKELIGIPKMEYISGIVEKIIDYNSEEALLVTKEVINDGKDITNVLWEMIKYLRDILLYLSTKEISNIYSAQDVKKIKEISTKIDKERLLNIIFSLSELENSIKWSSQKNIVFQVGILKLCSKENDSIEQRVQNLEDIVKKGQINFSDDASNKSEIEMNKTIDVTNKTKKETSKTTEEENKTKIEIGKSIAKTKKGKNEGQNIANDESKINKTQSTDFWKNVIEKLKKQRMPTLYANLANATAIILDDMTVGIEFPNGLNSFGRSVIEKPENMAELKKLISVECKKDMRIKLIDKKDIKDKSNNDLNFGFNVNVIDE